MNERIVKTGLTGNKAFEILDSVFGQLSDGKWENSPCMEKYWRFFSVAKTENDEVILKISNDSMKMLSNAVWVPSMKRSVNKFIPNKFKGMTDREVKNWFAAKIKNLAKDEAPNCWKRDDTTHLDYLSYKENITGADAYAAYDKLKERI